VEPHISAGAGANICAEALVVGNFTILSKSLNNTTTNNSNLLKSGLKSQKANTKSKLPFESIKVFYKNEVYVKHALYS
jgi:hypothetical protein